MKIAEVAPPWVAVPPRGYGGIEWVVAHLADGLAGRGHDVTLFASGDSSSRAGLEHAFEAAPGPMFVDSIWHDAVHQMLVYREPSRFDVIHQHTCWSGLVAAMLSPVPVVHTLHGVLSEEMRRVYEPVAERLWFVAISEAQRATMPELRYAGVVYNGIDLSMYPLREEKEDFLLFLGRAHPDKGLRRAAEAAAAAGLPLVMAVKIATPLEADHWEREVSPALPEGTTVLHEIPLDEKVDLLSRARAVLFPIDWNEPFGLVMAEAMACGTPVIATPRGSVPEVLDDGVTGFVVPVEDYAEAAAEALGRVGDIDPQACRAHVEKRFSMESMVAGYEAVFERVAAEA